MSNVLATAYTSHTRRVIVPPHFLKLASFVFSITFNINSILSNKHLKLTTIYLFLFYFFYIPHLLYSLIYYIHVGIDNISMWLLISWHKIKRLINNHFFNITKNGVSKSQFSSCVATIGGHSACTGSWSWLSLALEIEF